LEIVLAQSNRKIDSQNPSDTSKAFPVKVDQILKTLSDTRAIAILRKCPQSALSNVVAVLEQTGFRLVEITLDSILPFDLIGEISSKYSGVIVGAGTVHDVDQVEAVAKSGGRFIVAPVISEEVIAESLESGLGIFPGAATPSEIAHAIGLGVTAVKVFPAQQLGGPSFIKAIMSPLLNPPLIPTGAVDIDNAANYIEAGAIAVGVGSAVIKPKLIEAADFLGLERLLNKLMKSIL
jgi:2-dehydro-3-deoxyphosphogluconate aldolase/(4S)-4-hydroxy-2-oxoglutarate aldolase